MSEHKAADNKEEKLLEEIPAQPAPGEDNLTDKAVDDIAKSESDKVLDAEDTRKFQPPKQPWHRQLFFRKKVWIPLAILVLLIILGAVPITRYVIAGMFWKQTYKVQVLDAQTGKPVSAAMVTLAGKTVETDNKGDANLKVKAGNADLTISKKYYSTSTAQVLVGFRAGPVHSYRLHATGRQVPLVVVNTISGKPIADATVAAAGTTAKTDPNGKVTMVLPADISTVSAKLTAGNYNGTSVTVQVTTAVVSGNTFQMTPEGKIYFLSNASGKIDVVSTNLDGTGRQTVLAGTGNENPHNTVLLNSPDNKYLVLMAQRTSDSSQSAIYLITTDNGKFTTFDSGLNVDFSPLGWTNDDHFIYLVNRNSLQDWQAGAAALKSYDPGANQINTLDQTQGIGTSTADFGHENFGSVYIFNNNVLYTKAWNGTWNELSGKSNSILSINANNTDKRTLKTVAVPAYDTYTYISSEQTGPESVDFQVPNSNDGSSTLYYSYQNGAQQVTDISAGAYNQASNNVGQYELSPAGDKMLTAQIRDGQLVLQTGPSDGSDPQTVATLSNDYSFYDWYGENYILVSYKGNQLEILPATGLSGSRQPTKITDYFQGYYYGYYGGKGN